MRALERHGVNLEGLIVDDQRQTTTKTRVIAHSQQVVRVDAEQVASLTARQEAAILQWAEKHVPAADACILSDYAKGVVSSGLAERFIRMAREAGKPVVVDPKGTDYARYRGATVVKPNVREAERSARLEITDEDSLLRVGRHLSALLEGSALLVTRGSQGMTLFQDGSPPVHIPTLARHVFDVTGAGDTVVSTLAMGLAAGSSLQQAAHLANWAASIAVGKVGTAIVTLDELLHRSLCKDSLSEANVGCAESSRHTKSS